LRRFAEAPLRPPPRKKEFTTADAYAFTRELEKLHPDDPVN
jgi:hypothetical protein